MQIHLRHAAAVFAALVCFSKKNMHSPGAVCHMSSLMLKCLTISSNDVLPINTKWF